MTIQDDAALLRRAAQKLRRVSNLESGPFGNLRAAKAFGEDAAALESLATRLEGCVPSAKKVISPGASHEEIVAVLNWNDCRAEFLRKLEGRE